MTEKELFNIMASRADNAGTLDLFLDQWKKDKEAVKRTYRKLLEAEKKANEMIEKMIRKDGKISQEEVEKSIESPAEKAGLLTEILHRLDDLDDSMDFIFELLARKGILPPPDERRGE